MASGGASSTQSSQQSKQNTGVTQRFKDPLSQSLSNIINPISSRIGNVALGEKFRLGGTPGVSGFNFGQNLNKFAQRGKFGLDPTFDTAISRLGSNLFSKASGAAATRGQLSPENLSNVVGSAVSQAAPQLAGFAEKSRQRELFGPAQLAKQIQGIRFNPQLKEEQVRQQRLAQSLSSVGAISQALGGFGSSFGKSSGSSFNFGLGG